MQLLFTTSTHPANMSQISSDRALSGYNIKLQLHGFTYRDKQRKETTPINTVKVVDRVKTEVD